MDTTRDLYSLYLVAKLMELLVNNLLSLAIAAVAMEIRIRTSAVLHGTVLGQGRAQVLKAGHIF
ncbi:hypothetical protein DPMN_150601 [Dreissena polymorpha]|uniref:Uncharacterized protein n=1 Tax=Dreissena polymorpha TaxID=45954 RepID=A0A9D4FIA3_DREPO|nr:hypothetical protein DPMN_150601 [Dreissena polymorpha]